MKDFVTLTNLVESKATELTAYYETPMALRGIVYAYDFHKRYRLPGETEVETTTRAMIEIAGAIMVTSKREETKIRLVDELGEIISSKYP